MTSRRRSSARRTAVNELADVHAPSVWNDRDDRSLDLIGKTTMVLLITYMIMNRAISDRFVLPVGFSIRVYEVVLVMLLLAWAVWIYSDPHPFPTGLVGLFGLLSFALLATAPFFHTLTASTFQSNASERGLFRLVLFTGLFLAAFHLAFYRRYAFTVLGWLVGATAMQASFALYEFITATPVRFLDAIATSIGLIPDPRSIRGEFVDVFERLGGQIRAVATAPHPIVLSAVVALGVLVVGTWLLHAQSRRTAGWLIIAGTPIVLALPVTNSRTAFVILGITLIPLFVLNVGYLPRIIMMTLPAIMILGVAFAISPGTPRLLLNSITNPGDDQNTTVRIERFSRVPELLSERPLVGAGYMTHDPGIQIFDNAYNKGVIEFGVLGFAAVISFFFSALVTGWRATLAHHLPRSFCHRWLSSLRSPCSPRQPRSTHGRSISSSRHA